MTTRILVGDCRDILPTLPDASVHTVVTSPPYWGLRDYGTAGQIGLEADVSAYVAEMVAVFREVRRVLRADGTLWLNLGDCYANDGKWGGATGGKHAAGLHGSTGVGRQKLATGLKPKDLIGLPWRVAFALQADGWWLRSDIIWSKPNPMPESVKDRPTRSHEYVFLLTKSERYFYDHEAVRETCVHDDVSGDGPDCSLPGGGPPHRGLRRRNNAAVDGRNRRSVWTVPPQPFSQAHFATFPPALVEPCILSGTSAHGCCPACGAPWTRVVERGDPDPSRPQASRAIELFDAAGLTDEHKAAIRAVGTSDAGKNSVTQVGSGRNSEEVLRLAGEAKAVLGGYFREFLMGATETTGWRPVCRCDAGKPLPCKVLDPFAGAGTTGLVADRLGRNAVLIELNPHYAEMARRRIADDAPLFAEVLSPAADRALGGRLF